MRLNRETYLREYWHNHTTTFFTDIIKYNFSKIQNMIYISTKETKQYQLFIILCVCWFWYLQNWCRLRPIVVIRRWNLRWKYCKIQCSWSEVLTRMRMIFDGWLKFIEPNLVTSPRPIPWRPFWIMMAPLRWLRNADDC